MCLVPPDRLFCESVLICGRSLMIVLETFLFVNLIFDFPWSFGRSLWLPEPSLWLLRRSLPIVVLLAPIRFAIFRFLLSLEVTIDILLVRIEFFGAIVVLFFVIRVEVPDLALLATLLTGLVAPPILVTLFLMLSLLTGL